MGTAGFELTTQRLGPLPLVNHYLDRLGLLDILDRFVPTPDARTHEESWEALCRVAPGTDFL